MAAQQTHELHTGTTKHQQSLDDHCCMHRPGPLLPESKMDPKGNRAEPETTSLVPEGVYSWPRSAKALSYFPSIPPYTLCRNAPDSIVTTPFGRTTAFPRQLGWSCLFARTHFASVHTEWVHFSLCSSPTQRNIYVTN